MDRHDFGFGYDHHQGDAVTQIDGNTVQSGQSAFQCVQPQRRMMRIGLEQLERPGVLRGSVRVTLEKPRGAAVVMLGKYELRVTTPFRQPAWRGA